MFTLLRMLNVYTTCTHMYPHVKKFRDKNAFEQDAYCLFQWLPQDVSTRGLYLLGSVPFQGVYLPEGVPGIPTPGRDLGPGIPHPEGTCNQASTAPYRQTHACENITFPQLRWLAVKKLAPTGWYFGMSHLLNTSTVNPDHSDLCNEVCR